MCTERVQYVCPGLQPNLPKRKNSMFFCIQFTCEKCETKAGKKHLLQYSNPSILKSQAKFGFPQNQTKETVRVWRSWLLLPTLC